MFVEDNRTFAVILSIPPWDRELRALRSEHAYMTAALSLPVLAPWVHPDQSEPITPVLPMGSLQNLHRSLPAPPDELTRPIRSKAQTSDAFPPMTGMPVIATIPQASGPANGSAGRTNDQATEQIVRSRATGQWFRPLPPGKQFGRLGARSSLTSRVTHRDAGIAAWTF